MELISTNLTKYFNFILRFASTIILTVIITACGGGGGSESSTPPPPPLPPANVAPTANAGSDQTVDEETTVTLSGSGTDSDGSINSYSWTQTAGASVTINNSTTNAPNFTAPTTTTQLTLTFQLTITDNDGATASDTVNISVNPVNTAPTANAGSDKTVDEKTTVTLSGSGTDSDGNIDSYLWRQTAGTTVALSDPNISNPVFTAPSVSSVETLSFEVTVTDNEGASDTATMNVLVNPAGMPKARFFASNTSGPSPLIVVFDGTSSSDSDGSIETFTWDFGEGSQSSSATVTHTYQNIGEYTITLTVTDNDGKISSATLLVNVMDEPYFHLDGQGIAPTYQKNKIELPSKPAN